MNFPDEAYTRRAGTITDKMVERSFPVYSQLKVHFLELLRSAQDYERARVLLDESGLDVRFITDATDLLFEGMTTMDATGRSFVVEKDRAFSEQARRSPSTFRMDGVQLDHLDVGWFLCADGLVKISFDLIPQAAVTYLKKKALTIASIENDDLLKALKARLIDAAEKGLTYSQFEEEADKVFSSFGVEPLYPHRIQTVFRTNLFSAYSVGQLEQISQMPESFPLWRYVSILDSATRPDHRALNGKIFRVGEGPYPPIDYNCRCSAQHIHAIEAREAELRPSSSPDLPETVRRFDVQADFERWSRRKISTMNPGIRDRLERGEV